MRESPRQKVNFNSIKLSEFMYICSMKKKKKAIIYQLMPRWFTNCNGHCIPNGSISQNSCGKFNDIDEAKLRSIKSLGATHVWFTGIIEHATTTDYSRFGIKQCHPSVVKGKAGSPYAIRDYYDVCPDFAEKVNERMAEFERLVQRTHQTSLKVIIDFVPNHVARQYGSDVKPAGTKDLGEGDDSTAFFLHPITSITSPDKNSSLMGLIWDMAKTPTMSFLPELPAMTVSQPHLTEMTGMRP